MNRPSSRIVRGEAARGLAQEFWIVPKVKIKNSTSSVYSSLYARQSTNFYLRTKCQKKRFIWYIGIISLLKIILLWYSCYWWDLQSTPHCIALIWNKSMLISFHLHLYESKFEFFWDHRHFSLILLVFWALIRLEEWNN